MGNHRTHRLPALLALLALLAGTTSCGRPVTSSGLHMPRTAPTWTATVNAAPERTQPLVRFVNALPGANGLRIDSDGRAMFANIDFNGVTSYLALDPDPVTFSLHAPGIAVQVAARTDTMAPGYRYTIVALSDQHGGAALSVFRDGPALVADSSSHVRVIHAAPGLAKIDVAIAGTQTWILGRVGYDESSRLHAVVPMPVTMAIRRAGTNEPLVPFASMTLRAGTSYTVVITGQDADRMTAITFDDAQTTPAPTVRRPPPRIRTPATMVAVATPSHIAQYKEH